MNLKYLRTQADLADALIYRIDKYWSLEMEETIFISEIKELVTMNRDLMTKDGDYTSIIRQRLGKKRLTLLEKIMND